MKPFEFIFNVILFVISLFLLYLTFMPITTYDQIAQIVYVPTYSSTDAVLNTSPQGVYLYTVNPTSIYKSQGAGTFSSMTNSYTLKSQNDTYIFDVNADVDKFIIPYLSKNMVSAVTSLS